MIRMTFLLMNIGEFCEGMECLQRGSITWMQNPSTPWIRWWKQMEKPTCSIICWILGPLLAAVVSDPTNTGKDGSIFWKSRGLLRKAFLHLVSIFAHGAPGRTTTPTLLVAFL